MGFHSALSFDDVVLVPQYSNLDSRNDVDLSVTFCERELRSPIISAAMDSVTDINMALAMQKCGCLGVHHRYTSNETLYEAMRLHIPIAVSPSMGMSFFDNYPYTIVESFPILFIDVAHGSSRVCHDFAKQIKYYGHVVSGNIVTADAAKRYEDIGVNILRVGIGPGSVCSTRVVAGVGIPQLSAIMEIREACPDAIIIADGGIRSSGDAVKALAAGADLVMLGRLLAGAKEAPGKREWYFKHNGLPATWSTDPTPNLNTMFVKKEYSGMASEVSLERAGKEMNIEGESTWVKEEGPVADIIDRLNRGMRAGLAYTGSRTIGDLRANAEWRLVTQNGWKEGLPNV